MPENSYAFVDIETSGGSAMHDRVIEVAVLWMDDHEVTRSWSTLVQPECTVSPFITGITGITNAMLENAPTFPSVARELLGMLDGRVFVAHSARFDYGFLKNEFRRCDIAWNARTLCTVRLSRALYPRFRQHGLDAVMERHGIACGARHRAMGDAEVMTRFWHVARAEHGPDVFDGCVRDLLKQHTLPSLLDGSFVDDAPGGTGVYLFYGDGDRPLYIGKSVRLKGRVLSHFSGDHENGKDLSLSRQLKRIEYRETAGELGALLLESRLIKEYLPLYNRMLRRSSTQCALRLERDRDGFDVPCIVNGDDIRPQEFDGLFGVFRTTKGAKETLTEIAAEHGLCPRRLGIEKGKGACFAHHLKQCRGACTGEETADAHNMRLALALARLRHRTWPFPGPIGVRERHPLTEKTEVHLLDQWCHLGTYATEHDIREALEGAPAPRFDMDAYRIIARYLKKEDRRYGEPDIIPLRRQNAEIAEWAA